MMFETDSLRTKATLFEESVSASVEHPRRELDLGVPLSRRRRDRHLDQRSSYPAATIGRVHHDMVDLHPPSRFAKRASGSLVLDRRDVARGAPVDFSDPNADGRILQETLKPSCQLFGLGRSKLIGPCLDVEVVDKPVEPSEQCCVARCRTA